VAALLGVLKAGGVYLPLDPSLPGERLAWIAVDAGAAALVARGPGAPELAALGLPLVPPDGDEHPEAAPPADALAGFVPPEAAAYVIYTSGSTGRPKGVVVQHAELARHCQAAARAFGLGPGDRLLQFMAPGFDVSVEQMLAPLVAGACVAPAARSSPPPRSWRRWCARGGSPWSIPRPPTGTCSPTTTRRATR
jgi:non-ribosomal peptide synthetase component F